MSQYVCARVTSMEDIDIGLFDFDRHNALYYFVLNADEQIYLRYGGRDAESATTYLDLHSLELALEQGLAAHRRYVTAGEPKAERPEALYPRQIELLRRRTIDRRRCVECHLIADYQNQQLDDAGKLDRLRWMYRSPDIKTLGIHLDVPRGLVVDHVAGAAAAAGMEPGDRIVSIGGQSVLTFGDLQFHYDETPRDATQLTVTVERAATDAAERRERLTLDLPHQWWRTDLSHRFWTVEPLLDYESRPLTAARKADYGLPADGFASEVTWVARRRGRRDPSSGLRIGDITYSVDGALTDPVADSTDLFIKLRKRSGARVALGVLRDGERFELDLWTYRRSFRK